MSHEPLAILVPVLRRPHRVRPLVESVVSTTPQPVSIYFIADPGDWREISAIQSVGMSVLLERAGTYPQKINHAIRETDEPLIFLAADDVDFQAGWLEAALRRLRRGVGVVGTNDLCNPRTATGDLSTHTLIARWYVDEHGTIDEPGKALHEGYLHELCDDELVATAKTRGMYAHAPHAIVEHLHPMVGKAPMDPLYAQQRQRMRQGRRVFQQREHLWRT